MKIRRAVAALLVAPAALNWLGPGEPDSFAGPSVPTVVLLRPAKADEVTMEAMARVRGELKAAGFEVAMMPLRNPDARRDLESAGRDLHPLAAFAIFVYPSGDGTSVAEIWVSDRMRQKTIIQNALLHDTDQGRGSEILAVRAVELLRANLADYWTPTAPPAPSSVPPPRATTVPEVPARLEPQPRNVFAAGFGAGLGAGVTDGFGPLGATWAPEILASYGWRDGFSVRASLAGLGPAPTLSSSNGSATVEQQLGVLEGVWAFWGKSTVVPLMFAGLGAQHVHVAGHAAPPYQGHTSDVASALMTAGLGAGIPLGGEWWLVAQARGAVGFPENAVQINQSEVGRTGVPSLWIDAALFWVLQ